MQKFIAEAKRSAARICSVPGRLHAECASVAKKISALLNLAEVAPDSASLAARLRELEAERERIESDLANVEENEKLKTKLSHLSVQDARALISNWMEEDGETIEPRRSALGQLLEDRLRPRNRHRRYPLPDRGFRSEVQAR